MSKKVQQASDSIVKKKPDSVPFFKLFRYATKFDYLLMTSGSLTVVINGICLPIVSFCFGKLINAFSPSNSYDETISIAGKYTGILAGIGVLSFLLSYISFASWMITGERQGIEYRKAYFKALLNQEIGFYDTVNPSELASKVSFECFAIQSGIGEKVCSFTYTITLILAGFVVAFVQGWELALVISAWIPAMIIAGVVLALAMTKAIMSSQQNYYQAGAIIEESLASIKTVVSLNGQEKEVSRYKAILQEALKKATRFGFYIGAGLGLMYTGINGTYLVGLWYGSKLVQEQKINPMTDDPWDMGQVVGIYFALLYGALSMAQITPCLKAFSGARVAAAKAFEIIDRKSKMSVNDGKGAEVRLDGDIEFKGVTFAYLGAPEKKVLDQVSFSIKKNQKTALVGESGSGKTTCMQLIQRFYDIESGSIKFDGQEISGINLKSLRSQIGYVGQEPALFAASIKENLLMAREDATEKDLWEALKKANVADFVNSLPNKLETFVGNNGTQLSGGQKQRLAIARAILKNPKILLLDEATSALDRKNEREIQKTLDDISKGRTTIVIAHRLTTILNSDNIIVFDQGRVIEQGTHEDLIRNHDGKYYNLQKLQLKSDKEAVQEEQDAQQQEPAKGVKTSFEVEVNVHDPLILKDANHRPKSVEPAEEKHVFWRLLSYNKQEAIYIFAGVVSAIVNGATFPLFAIFFANILAILSQPVTPSFREDVNKWLFWFLGDALVCLASNVSQNGFFGLVGENLTLKLRTEVFRKVLKMSMYWFDKPENAPASLSAKLALEAYMANSLTSSTVGNYIQTISSFTTYLVIAFISSWQFALVTLAFAPLFFYSGKIQAAYSQGFSAANDAAYTASSRIIGEVVNNMKTVQSFGAERRLFKAYEDQLQAPLDNATQRGKSSGFAFGTSQFVQISLFALLFLIGAVFVKKINISPKNAFQCIFAFFYCTFTSGNASQFAPDVNFAKRCAKNLFKILDYKPEIDIDEPSQDIKTPIKGEVEFKNVWFKYPSREKYILKGVSFKINAFTKVAFVGSSGCGKSTIFTLLLRFYNPDSGEILVDGIDIKKYDLRHLRKSFGAVFQEPSLFNNTIKYNIKYAREDATDEEMKKAAEDANALTFIEQKEASEGSSSLGTGFYKQVGPKGSQMSGGQKQRIAIARTMITKPSVLLLDEATSALDSQNEKIVQESLDKAMAGKTSIIVAHRISTIKDAQQILVFQDGQIIERGNYETLVRNQGAFYRIEKGLNITK